MLMALPGAIMATQPGLPGPQPAPGLLASVAYRS